MGKVNGNQESLHFQITNKDLINKSLAYVKANKIYAKDLCEMALKVFFEDKRNQLKGMSKEQLIDIILAWDKQMEEGEKKC